MPDEQVAKRNRSQVVIMLMAFPLLSAFAVYSLIWLAQRDTLLETTNLGEFVDPPVLARELGLRGGSGEPVDGSGSWWVWLVTADCTAACERSLEEMQALPQRLGDSADQVRQALVSEPEAVSMPSSGRFAQTTHFSSDGEKSLAAGIYLVDPMGYVVLKYPADTGMQPIVEDLLLLLEASEDA